MRQKKSPDPEEAFSFLENPELGSPREREVLQGASEGLTDKEIAARLGISRETVATYWKRIRGRLRGASRTQAVAEALKMQTGQAMEEMQEENVALAEEVERRRRLEEELETTVRQLSALLHVSEDAVVFVDEAGEVAYCNESFIRMFDLHGKFDSVIGSPMDEIFAAISTQMGDSVAFLAKCKEMADLQELIINESVVMQSGRRLIRDYIPILTQSGARGAMWQWHDVTDMDSLVQRLRGEAALARAAAVACSGVSHALKDDLPNTIAEGLEALADATGGDRAQLFSVTEEEKVEIVSEWTRPGVEPERSGLKGLPRAQFEWLIELAEREHGLVIARLDDLPESAEGFKAILRSQGSKSAAFYPAKVEKDVMVMVISSQQEGIEWPLQASSSVDLASKAIAAALSRCAD